MTASDEVAPRAVVRPDRTDAPTLGESSLAVHGGIELDSTRSLRTPLVMSNSFALPDDPSEISWSATAPGLYTRNTGVNQLALERKLAALSTARTPSPWHPESPPCTRCSSPTCARETTWS
ncbi:hypothetical protein ACFZA2_15850 [Microbacterium sp. NPDC007973]|uniref:hypothetical protein n=1 Tax=Microbacterium sp. NPDC007973 TaxID=3364182 RepID=UPI0036EC0CE2